MDARKEVKGRFGRAEDSSTFRLNCRGFLALVSDHNREIRPLWSLKLGVLYRSPSEDRCCNNKSCTILIYGM